MEKLGFVSNNCRCRWLLMCVRDFWREGKKEKKKSFEFTFFNRPTLQRDDGNGCGCILSFIKHKNRHAIRIYIYFLHTFFIFSIEEKWGLKCNRNHREKRYLIGIGNPTLFYFYFNIHFVHFFLSYLTHFIILNIFTSFAASFIFHFVLAHLH